MKIPRSDPVKTCGRAITMDDFRDEKIIAESGPVKPALNGMTGRGRL